MKTISVKLKMPKALPSTPEYKKALQMGIKHELEHTGSKRTAKIIAIPHILGDINYYTKIKKAGL